MYIAVQVRFSRFYWLSEKNAKAINDFDSLTLCYIGVMYPDGLSHKPVL
jgi:hypothetical protein